MKTYIALLRGINVSGQKKIIMADLKIMFEELGCTSVSTYIQSGNIVFQHKKDMLTFTDIIKKEILTQFGFDVPVLVLTREMLTTIYDNNPFLKRLEAKEIEDKKMYFTLLSRMPDHKDIEDVESTTARSGNEEFVIAKDVVYFYAANGYGKTKLNNNFFEKKLQSTATTRNLKTVIKLLELSKLD
ncbi:DUF1697 domain-containing protein [Aquimarina algiphila]|uniref:DUF1697 domain-containing protein n=1 Tax=Aquimarina algiphila TaxID=2047982 RepID=UPI00232ABF11|nr:DUF1697 domain-containing protein [Aquimarina algiphila]